MFVEIRKLVVNGLFDVLPRKLFASVFISIKLFEMIVERNSSGAAILEFNSGRLGLLYGFGSWGLLKIMECTLGNCGLNKLGRVIRSWRLFVVRGVADPS